jgi:hypothetical protein
MNQCIQFAEQMSIPPPSLKRRRASDQSEYAAKRITSSEHPLLAASASNLQGHMALAPGTGSHVTILPRPVNGYAPSPPQPAAPAVPKKRGRPSRADKAKRDLRPILPQHLAPRPTPTQHSSHSPRPLLPALATPIQESRPITPPVAYSASPGSSDGAPGRKRVRAPSGDRARPVSSRRLHRPGTPPPDTATQRVLAEGAPVEAYARTHRLPPSGPTTLEPEPRESSLPRGPPGGPPTTLPPLLERHGPATPIGPSIHEVQAPLTNSA